MIEQERLFWVSKAMALGASQAWMIAIDDVVMDPRARLKCRVPLCSSFGKNLMCPPFLLSYRESEEAIRRYNWGLLVKLEVQAIIERDRDLIHAGALDLHKIINQLEKVAFERGYRFAAGLIGGTCRLCDRCVAETGGTICRHPFEARPSMEAMGIDVVATLERLGIEAPEFPPRDKVEWIGLLLLE
ncbi:MAG TPA: DUF2284 domain-containing protein [Firmicutes bacterium]|nr:DUF2284 domain-containing protein [Candidatus Fermentithermobacillaceae bacterium]